MIRCASRRSRAIWTADLVRVLLRPAVGEDHHHRAPGQPAAAVLVEEVPEAVRDPGAAGPVRRGDGGAGQGLGPGRAGASCRVRRGQPGGEDEGLGAGRRPLRPGAGRRRCGRTVPSTRRHRTASPACGAARGGGHTAAGWCRCPSAGRRGRWRRTSRRALLWADLRVRRLRRRAAWRAAAGTPAAASPGLPPRCELGRRIISCSRSSAEAMARTASRSGGVAVRRRSSGPAEAGRARSLVGGARPGARSSAGDGRVRGSSGPVSRRTLAGAAALRRGAVGSKPPRNTAAKTASKTGQLLARGHEHHAAGPVELLTLGRRDQAERLGQPCRPVRGARTARPGAGP